MGDRIARHHELESVKTREEVYIHIALPHASLTTHLRMDMSDDLIEKCPRACRRIEDLDSVSLYGFCFSLSFLIIFLDLTFDMDLARIGESFRESEMSPEDIIDCSDDKLHHRSWRIEYSSLHTELCIIFF